MRSRSLPPDSPNPSGQRLGGRWIIDATLNGAMGTVFLLVDPATGARMAAKTPRLGQSLGRGALARFEVEARTWLSLGHHPNVVEALFLEEIEHAGERRPFLFLEYVEGPTLDRLLRSEGPLALAPVLDLATGMAWGMAYAHGEGRPGARIVHRDLKPENVFVDLGRVVKVSDFGIARALDRPEELVAEGHGAGTPFYVAPEQMKDARVADRRSDLYSFGAVLYEMLTGRPPFEASDLSALVFKVLREQPEAPSSLRPDVPPGLDLLVRSCLEKRPADRPQSFREALVALSEVRETDALWTPPRGARSCPACGWLSMGRLPVCPVCRKPLSRALRYAPVSPRSLELTPTLGRSPGAGHVEIEAVEIRPRVPRCGEELVVTLLLGNPGGEPVEDVVVPYGLPDEDAFARRPGSGSHFTGTVPPTAPEAPLRVSWTVLPIREGIYTLHAPGAFYRGSDGRRRVVRAADQAIEVMAAERIQLVGRDVELEQLDDCVETAATGTGALALVLGPQGSGKSMLTREVRGRAEARGFRGARGRCLNRGTEVRGALKEAARQILRLPGRRLTAGEVAAAVVDTLGDSFGLGEFLVDELLARPLPRGDNPARMWARFAVAIARLEPLLLVFEDVQRDPEVGRIALHMMQHARRSRVPLLVVLTGRADETGPRGRVLTAAIRSEAEEVSDVRVVELGALDLTAVRALVAASFQPNDFEQTAPWLAEKLYQLSGGHALTLVELVSSLRSRTGPEGALVEAREGFWTATESLTPEHLESDLPAGLDQLVLSRLGAFDAETLVFLRAAATLGDLFESEVLSAVLGSPPFFDRALGQLEAAGILRERAGEPPRIRFREPLVPEVLDRELATADPVERKRLHGLAAAALEALPGARGRNALRLARHHTAAGDRRAALECLLAGGRMLVQRQSYNRARHILEEAERRRAEGVELPRRQRLELQLLRGEVLRFTGDLEGALSAYRSVIERDLAGRDPGAELATVYSKMGKVHQTLGQLDQALYCFAVGLSLREEHGLEHDVPMSLVNLGGLHLLRGESDRADDYLRRAVASGTAVGNHTALAMAHAQRAELCVQQGDPASARHAVRVALREARLSRNRRATALAWEALGGACLHEARLRPALAHYQRTLRVRQEMGDRASVGDSWMSIGQVHELAGDQAAASAASRRAIDTYRSIGQVRGVAAAVTRLGRIELSRGRPRRARKYLEQALAEYEGRSDPLGQATAKSLLATALGQLGQRPESRRLFAESLAELAGRDAAGALAGVLLQRFDAFLAWGDTPQAGAELRDAEALAGIGGDLRLALSIRRAELDRNLDLARGAVDLAGVSVHAQARARALAAHGRVAFELGHLDEAGAVLRQAAGLLRQSGSRGALLLDVLRRTAAALAETDPASSRAALARAADLAQEMEARGFAPEYVCEKPLVASDSGP